MLAALTALLLAWPALADEPARFEVASIRASQTRGREIIQAGPASLTMRNVRFRSRVRWAYHVVDYQVTGPDWIDEPRFDIVARAPSAVAEEQLRVMLLTLLADRFHLAAHREKKEASAWILSVGKNGPKFHES